jgi:COX assembly mitochondrial protein 2
MQAGCAEVIDALEECHARGFLFQVVGGCNKAKKAVDMCLRRLRLERTKLNHEEAKIRNEKFRKAWAEIDENS